MRNICLIAVLLALPFTADAQQRRSGERRSGDQRSEQRHGEQRQADQRQSQQRPTTGLGPLGLQPAPAPNLPWWERRQTPSWEQRQTPPWELTNPSRAARSLYQQPVRGQRLDGRARSHRNQPPVVYVLPPYRYFPGNTVLSYGVSSSTTYVTPPPPVVETVEPLVETGFLRLEVEPRHLLQVFVDGLYLGTIADLGDEIELRLGARRIELRAPGYRTLIFDTQIVPDRTIVYRGALEPIANAPAPSAPAPSTPAPSTFAPRTPAPPTAEADAPGRRVIYVIPGCYMGNVSPKDIKLRPGCDIANLTTISPP